MDRLHRLALYSFGPAILLVAWGELSRTPDVVALEGLFWDKSLHFTAYFGLSGLICLALKQPRRVLVAAINLILFAGVLEILQGFTGRDPDLYDQLANSLGVVAGTGTGSLIIWALTPKSQPREPTLLNGDIL